MSTTRLEMYNAALTLCAERHLASLTEDRKSRRLLDHVWDNQGVEACLERGQWKFAMRTIKVEIDLDQSLDFGYANAFSKPTDWVLTSSLCSDEFFDVPVTRYEDENDFWYAEIDPIYVRYVSNATDFGNDLSLWPSTFSDFVSAHFAKKIVAGLTHDETRIAIVDKEYDLCMKYAKNNDAMAGPQRFPAPGHWVSGRNRGRTIRDNGSRSRLIG